MKGVMIGISEGITKSIENNFWINLFAIHVFLKKVFNVIVILPVSEEVVDCHSTCQDIKMMTESSGSEERPEAYTDYRRIYPTQATLPEIFFNPLE